MLPVKKPDLRGIAHALALSVSIEREDSCGIARPQLIDGYSHALKLLIHRNGDESVVVRLNLGNLHPFPADQPIDVESLGHHVRHSMPLAGVRLVIAHSDDSIECAVEDQRYFTDCRSSYRPQCAS